METIRIGSRESLLAVVQSRMVMRYIDENCQGLKAELVTMKTTGDKILDRNLDKVGGKGLFVKELDKALLAKETDLSVHSLKDMPMEVPEELPLIGYSRREDPRDVLVLPQGATEVDLTKPIGCSSNRRILQLKKLYPGAEFKPIRGNVQTRLKKLDSGEYSATVLAAAGLKRLGLENRISRYFGTDEMIPAAGQGVLALQGRQGLDYTFMQGFLDQEAYYTSEAERAFVAELNGGCSSPVAAFAWVDGHEITIRGLYYDEDKDISIIDSLSGNKEDAVRLGRELAVSLRERGI